MRERWLNLSWAGHHDVAAGLLREGQFELATEKMAQMRGDGIKVEGWLKDMAVLMLIEAGELDEALQLLKDRIADGELNISKAIWYSLLDQGSAAFHVSSVTCMQLTRRTTADMLLARCRYLHLEQSGRPRAPQPVFWHLLQCLDHGSACWRCSPGD